VSLSARILESVQRCLDSLIDCDNSLVVAVSGGADSVGLLRAFLALRPKGMRLAVAHVNHRLRGEESDADAVFVEQLVDRLIQQGEGALTFHCQQIDLAVIARAEGENLEAMGRKVRYQYLAEVARAEQMHSVATGHTADDQAETILHRLLRGTGLHGLRGIALRRSLEPGIYVVRPLLQISRQEILAFLKDLNQPFREDSSNANLDFTRNRIRLELIPYLSERYNPRIAQVLAHLAEQAQAASSSEQDAAGEVLKTVELPRAGRHLVIDRIGLSQHPRQRIREVFRLIWSRESWPMNGMGFDAWERLADLALLERRAVDLVGGIEARRRETVILIGRKEQEPG
jgi:tRNA(Ile)-lysidine synthase